MRLAPRIALAVGACGVLLFGGGGLLLLDREAKDLRWVAQGETLLLGRSLQVAFENALRDRQLEDVFETLAALAPLERSVGIYVHDVSGAQVSASEGANPTEGTRQLLRRLQAQPVLDVEFAPATAGDPGVLRLGLPLFDDLQVRVGTLILEKPLDELERDLATTRLNVGLTALLFIVAVTGVTWLLARAYVGRPLSVMVADMQRVRDGDLRTSGRKTHMDEVGEAQQQFERLVRDLEAAQQHAVRETEARQRMERGLQRADKLITLGQLSAVLAHEIGSPLQILEGRARALLKHADDADRVRRTAPMLVEQTARITRIVEQLLSITRRRLPSRASVDAERAIGDVADLLEAEVRRRRVQLVVASDGNVGRILADADQLQQIALNLMRNALEASAPGDTVTVRLTGEQTRMLLEVEDEGPGIAPEIAESLFEPFVTTRAASGGNGLGLAVVKSLTQEHGGQVEVIQGGSRGCLARVWLPRGEGGHP